MDNVNVLRTGFIAPDFSLPDSSGEIFTLSSHLRDCFLALCFFPASPGDRIKGYLKDLNSGLPKTSTGLPVVTVAVTPEKTNSAAELRKDLKLDYPVLSDSKLKVSERYYLTDSDSFGTSVHFTIFVIDYDRIIRHRVSDYADYSLYDPGRLRETISKLF